MAAMPAQWHFIGTVRPSASVNALPADAQSENAGTIAIANAMTIITAPKNLFTSYLLPLNELFEKAPLRLLHFENERELWRLTSMLELEPGLVLPRPWVLHGKLQVVGIG